MKYITIIYGNKDLWKSFTPDEAAKAIAEVDAFNRRYKESGELLAAYGLGDELTAKTVRVRDGVPAVTDGPSSRQRSSSPASSCSTWIARSAPWRSLPSTPSPRTTRSRSGPSCTSRALRSERRRARRGSAAGPCSAGTRRARPPPPLLRPVRGRRSRRAHGSRRPVADAGHTRPPTGVAGHGGHPALDRSGPQRPLPAPAGGTGHRRLAPGGIHARSGRGSQPGSR